MGLWHDGVQLRTGLFAGVENALGIEGLFDALEQGVYPWSVQPSHIGRPRESVAVFTGPRASHGKNVPGDLLRDLVHDAHVRGVFGVESRPGVDVAVPHVAHHDRVQLVAVEKLLEKIYVGRHF